MARSRLQLRHGIGSTLAVLFVFGTFAVLPAGAARAASITIQYQVTSDTCTLGAACAPAPIGATYTVRYDASGPATINASGPATLLTAAGFPGASAFLGQSDPTPNGASFLFGSNFASYPFNPAGSLATGAFVQTAVTNLPGFPPGLVLGTGSHRAFRWMVSSFVYGPFVIPTQVQVRRTFARTQASVVYPGVTVPTGARVFSHVLAESQEISRSFVPEPATGTLLLLGMSGLAGLEVTRRCRIGATASVDPSRARCR